VVGIGGCGENIEDIYFMKGGRNKMIIYYNDRTDLLYIRLDGRKQEVINKRISEDIVMDIGENDKIIGIEILDTSKHVDLERLFLIKYNVSKTSWSG
jgi:uncharacterized protein YuzE